MSYNPKKLFDRIQKEQTSASENAVSGFGNPHIFKPKPGTTYSVRLLWLAPEAGYDREYPMINSFIHRCWDDSAANGNKDNKVICPTSQYMMGETSAALKRCPICSACSDFYKKGQEGSESSQELYKKFRRTLVGYIPIYIVNGPEEDLHQVKILQYGKQFKDFFDSKIFGIKKQARNGEDDAASYTDDEAYGLDAFMYYDETNDEVVTKGANLLITTTTKKMVIGGKSIDMPQYQLDFSRKLSTITDIDGIDLEDAEGIKYFNSLNSSVLHFDQDFYIKSTDEDLNNFKLQFITRAENGEFADEPTIAERPAIALPKKAKTVPVVEAVEEEEEDEIPMGKTAEVNTKRAKAKPAAVEDMNEEIPRTADGEVDVQAMLDGILNME